jgi:hypothetical protein
VIFPGGFGTLDEMFEILTLMQTQKLAKQIQIILYGSEYWDPILNLEPLAEWGAIGDRDIASADARRNAGGRLRAAQGAPHEVSLVASDDAGERKRRESRKQGPSRSGTAGEAVRSPSRHPSSPRRSPQSARRTQPVAAARREPARMSIGILSCSYSYGGWRQAKRPIASRGTYR